MGKSKLTFYIFAALALGILVGCLFPEFAVSMKPLADAFLRMIKMIIAPLLFATLVVGIAGHGSIKEIGKLGFKTIVYFEIVTTIALVLGLVVGNITKPGVGINITPTAEQIAQLESIKNVEVSHSIASFINHMIPESIIDAMSSGGEILQLVFFALFFAFALSAIGDKGKPVLNILKSLSEVMFKFTEYVMNFAPIGVFAAIANTVGQNGAEVLFGLGKLVFVLYASLIVFVALVLVVACNIAKIPFFALIKAIKEPALLAFSTASSEAALPKAMEIMEKFGVPKNIVGFVMPTGYTFNLDGSTLYLALASLFVAQMSGISLSIQEQVMLMLALMLTSKGIAAVPRVSLVVLTATLSSFNLPVAGVAILLGIDQLLDMGRTTVNLIGNCVATTVVARWENSFNYNKMNAFIGKVPSKPPVKDIVANPHVNVKDSQLVDESIL